ncbi:VTT domain-containing protein [Gottfriedia acidiceleris]|uniref:VTT domain-containing protein n=1 Tax=Gottfriedia acidiceleris TaxID=371036 RepID=A0ABY4JGD0_9BACI|nr:VTT domain-containing protein [Gottfriedia acidiceleris]UPM52537.1 VTT domain-containing protein [Gottfriedia acidiceleris]
MEIIKNLIDLIMHLDQHLLTFVHNYGAITYFILFFIILLETGLVVTPFLPGDSLIFTAGALASLHLLNFFGLLILFIIAASLGDSLNYFIGKKFGSKLSRSKKINAKYIAETEHFFKQKGPKFIVLARFIPVVRTFAPFVAGIGEMNYSKFIPYNILGATLWVGLIVPIGYFFGNIPFVKNHFGLLTIGIIFVSIIPILIDVIRKFIKQK